MGWEACTGGDWQEVVVKMALLLVTGKNEDVWKKCEEALLILNQ